MNKKPTDKPNHRGFKNHRKSSPSSKPAPGKNEETAVVSGERVAKAIARAGLCSRREAESWIEAGRVSVNGNVLTTPAITVTAKDKVVVDGTPLPQKERTRLWLFHKPKGTVTTNNDPEGRKTVFSVLPSDLPRVVTVGRLDINTEGLLLLTNDGGLSRIIELPSTGWLRRYRVRAFGKVTQEQLDTLKDGVAIDGVLYGGIEATLDSERGENVWLTIGLREGKNREVKRVLEHLGLAVNRLIRISFGPFQLADLGDGETREIRGRILRDQLGEKIIKDAALDFDAPILHQAAPEVKPQKKDRKRKTGGTGAGWMSAKDAAAALSGNNKGKFSKETKFRNRDERKPSSHHSKTERSQDSENSRSSDRSDRAPWAARDSRRDGNPFGERKQFSDKKRSFSKEGNDRRNRYDSNERGQNQKPRRILGSDGRIEEYRSPAHDIDERPQRDDRQETGHRPKHVWRSGSEKPTKTRDDRQQSTPRREQATSGKRTDARKPSHRTKDGFKGAKGPKQNRFKGKREN
ncbi:pseudouridine synthase [Flexibacterium corallicola]|uniref:pseudouridine synthase n=1 Tax=Flexibacterium corallicola TaxID=3037259 RepID=UPI00286F7DF1|nr:pseudouridine synthase [Pseudovibrio sp. M1P-2-3]